jgi:hypothetical protein
MNEASSVTISLERFNSLLEAEAKLEALEAAGVDNWDGYDYAMEILAEMEKSDK